MDGKIMTRRIPATDGTILTGDLLRCRATRLEYFEKLRQAALDAGAVGLRSAQEDLYRRNGRSMAPVSNTSCLQQKEAGNPVEPVYATEGTR
jgi:hypothetical protein